MTSLFHSPRMPDKTQEQIQAEKHQAAEIERLKKEETARKNALSRRQGGRASLLSGSESGIKETLG